MAHASLFSGIGNAVVPQLVKVIFEAIEEYEFTGPHRVFD